MSRDLIERLREEARQTSEASRMLAQAKSRRQADNPTGEDIYTWLKPEETTAWQAADVIGRLVGALQNAQYALEFWQRESGVWLDTRVAEAKPGWMARTRRRGAQEITRARQALASIPSTTIDSQQETAVQPNKRAGNL